MSYRYPYGNTEQMNLDWFLNQWEKFKADWAEAEAGIDGSLDAEIAKVEAAMSELYAARDAAAASATAARQSSLDAAAAQVAAGNSKTAAQAAETAARGSQTAAAQSAQEAQASAQGAENSALTASQAANTATQQAAGAAAAKGAAEAAQQAAEDAQAAAAQSSGQAGQAATAAADHADDAADSATLAQQAAQDMSDSVAQITTNKNDISVLKESTNDLETALMFNEVSVVDITKYTSSNTAVTYNNDGTYTIGTSDYGTLTFNNGKNVLISTGEYELFGVPQGSAFIATSNSFNAAVFTNDTPQPKRITVSENQAGYMYVGFYIKPKPTTAFTITPFLRKIENAIDNSNAEIENLKRLTESTYNLASFDEQTFNYNGVTIKAHSDGTVELKGTATNVTRTPYLKQLALSSGSYRMITQSDDLVTNILAYNADTGTFISSGGFTLNDATNVGLAFTFTNAKEYNETLLVSLVKSENYVRPLKAQTAIDELARVRLDKIEAVKDAPYDMADLLSVNTKNNVAWSQGACTVGDKFVGFNASADDHATTANYFVCDVFDFSTKQTYSHNLGHCASADYNVKTDTMMVGNGAVSQDVLPTMYLVSDMRNTISEGSDILVTSENVTPIDITTIGGYGFVCCFGESECIAYAITQTATGKNFFKLLLGMGTNNMLSLYQQDSYGSFISGKADTEYNGTAHVLKKITATNVTGELQGLKFINGKIIMPTDENVNQLITSFISILSMEEDSILIEKNLWIPVLNTLGQPIRTECEDVTFHNGTGYVVTRSEVGGSNIFATHQFNF